MAMVQQKLIRCGAVPWPREFVSELVCLAVSFLWLACSCSTLEELYNEHCNGGYENHAVLMYIIGCVVDIPEKQV